MDVRDVASTFALRNLCDSSILFSIRIYILSVTYSIFLGMIHAGIGETHVNNLLSTLNLPSIHHKTLKRKEIEVGKQIQDVARESCSKALFQELSASTSNNDSNCSQKLEASFDGAWSKRGTGHNYNSNTGHSSLIGAKTGKIINYSVKSKVCRVCSHYHNKLKPVPNHECSANYIGSSKGMESLMAVEMCAELDKCGNRLEALHMDNDSTIRSRTKNLVNSHKSDKNHTKKSFNSSLYKLSSVHKQLKGKTTIDYLTRCFTYAMEQNHTPQSLSLELGRIVPHVYGEHSNCNIKWCHYKENPERFRFRSLPNGKPLSDPELRVSLDGLFKTYQDISTDLCQLGSTQANESFNSLVSSKAPKAR